jgi:HSP20 family protein
MKEEVTNMAIVRWEPFRELVSSQDKFNRLFTGMFPRFFEEGEGPMTTWAPAVDIVETDHDLTIKAELPGMDPKDIEARVEGGALYLKGERKFENETNKGNYHRVERSYGSFMRTFSLPTSVDAEKVAAEYKDGVLTLTLPKKEEAKPKTIKVQASKN